MYKEKIKELLAELEGKRALVNDKTQEMRKLLVEGASDDDLAKAKQLRSDKEQLEAEIREKEDLVATYRSALNGTPAPEPGPTPANPTLAEEQRAFNAYLHRDAAAAGVNSTAAAVTIPQSIQYNPETEVKSVTDLAALVTQFQATTASGTYPITKKATARMNTVQELEQNPDLAKPTFTNVEWKVDTYRGAIPLSQEAIDDSAIDLTGLVAQNAQEQKVNTTNWAIATVLKSFTAKAVAGESVDDIKHIINVDLDPAYNKVIIASQSFYQYLDTLKDKNGQYLLHAPITDGSPTMLLGCQVITVEDELLGAKGEAHAFVGDLARAVLFANRKDIQVQWANNDIYGQYLQAVVRFGTKAADTNAGYFVTYTPAEK